MEDNLAKSLRLSGLTGLLGCECCVKSDFSRQSSKSSSSGSPSCQVRAANDIEGKTLAQGGERVNQFENRSGRSITAQCKAQVCSP